MENRVKMLIANGAQADRMLLCAMFKNEYEITEAKDSTELLALLLSEENLFSIMLLDILLPGEDCYDILKTLQRNPHLSDIPILITSPDVNLFDRSRVFHLGVVDIIVKPYDPDTLYMKVQNILSLSNTDIPFENLLTKEKSWRQERLQSVLDNIPCGLAIIKTYGNSLENVYMNDAFYELFGLSSSLKSSSFFKEDPLHYVCKDDLRSLMRLNQEISQNKTTFSHMFRVRHTSGQITWVLMHGNPFGEEDGIPLYLVMFLDVTKEKSFEDELLYRANYDELTGMPNKDTFYRNVTTLLESDAKTKYLLVRSNIEKFKIVNELLGTAAGDKILKCLADYIVSAVSVKGVYGRLETDNFAFCLPVSEFDADIMSAQLESIFDPLKLHYKIVIDLGIYLIDDITLTVRAMCDRANMALQTVKGSYLKRYAYYDDDLRKALLKEQGIIKEMEHALKNNQFVIFLQPIFSVSTNLPVSAEALVRWNHPEKGIIAPGEFIPLFERNGFIAKLDYFVWEETCKYLRHRIDTGKIQFPISVNVSRLSLFNPKLCGDIVALTSKYEIPHSLLKLEITESSYTDTPKQLLDTMKELQTAGFEVLMDDFGNGYSSLSMLKDIPVNILKIDMRFLGGIETSGRAGNILTSVVRMAKWLSMPIIAEGVETELEVDFLKSIGCDKIQGFYFSSPLPIEQFELLVDDNILPDSSSFALISTESDFNSIFNGSLPLTRLLNNITGGIGFYELIGEHLEIIRANEGYFKMLGYDANSFFNDTSNVFDRVHPDDRDTLINACYACLVSGHAEKTVCRRYIHDSDDYLWLEVSASHLGGTDDRPIICFALNDITEERNREQLIQEKNDKILQQYNFLHQLYNTVPCGIIQYTCGPFFRIKSANRAALNMLGYPDFQSFSDAIGGDAFKPVHPDDLRAVIENTQKVIESGKESTVEHRLTKADGSVIWIRTIQNNAVTYDGFPVLQSGFIDITASKQAEYEHTLNKYVSALLSIYDEIFELDKASHTASLICTKLNGEFNFDPSLKILAETISVWSETHLHPDDQEAFLRFFSKYYFADALVNPDTAAGDVRTLEVRILPEASTPTNEYYWFAVSLLKIDTNKYLYCMLDINLRKHSESIAHELHALQEKRLSEDRFAAIVNQIGFTVCEWDLVNSSFYYSDLFNEYMAAEVCIDDLSKMIFPLTTIFPDDVGRVREFISEMISRTENGEIEARIQKKDKSYIWCRMACTHIYNENGKPIRIIGTLQDINSRKNVELQLKSASDQMQMIISSVPGGIAVFEISDHFNILYGNDTFYSWIDALLDETAVRNDRIINTLLNDSLFKEDAAHVIDFINDPSNADQVLMYTVRLHKDDSTIYVALRGKIIDSFRGNPVFFVVMLDVTVENVQREKDIQRRLTEEKEYRDALIAHTLLAYEFNFINGLLDGVTLLNYSQNFSDDFFNWSLYTDMRINRDLLHPEDRRAFLETFAIDRLIHEFHNGKADHSYQCRIMKIDRQWIWVNISLHLFATSNSEKIKGCAYFDVIDEFKKREYELRLKAEYDSLTGLFNRGTAEESINARLLSCTKSVTDTGTRSVLIIFDLDNFKDVNDTYGHPQGDVLLKEIGSILKAACKEGDIAGRLGGDEFLIYVQDAPNAEAVSKFIEPIASSISALKGKLGWDVGVFASFGAVFISAKDKHFEDLFWKADNALYRAKANGKNRYCIYDCKLDKNERYLG